ncbi:MAG TPA: T9SS type A sorting domain-containing protein, partial [Flavobacteriales bacterium]|nr:T9SS type A sorting domain-containing protein [Flavobacteriales bacterium]
IACWDGVQWSPIGNGLIGVFCTINLFDVHDDLLYVAGSFADYPPNGNSGNPGSGVVTWDGQNWAQLGSGTRGSQNPTVYGITWIRDTLYISGRFNRIGDIPTGRVARWDGTRWCSLVPEDYFYPDLAPVGSYRDTLLVGGSFIVAGPDSIDRIAKWVAGDYVNICGSGSGVSEHTTTSIPFIVCPNPATTTIVLHGLPQAATTFVVHDVLGREVVRMIARPPTLEIESLASGTYTVQVFDAQNIPLGIARFVKR